MNKSREKYQNLLGRMKSDIEQNRLEIEAENHFQVQKKLTKKLARRQAKVNAEAIAVAESKRQSFLTKWTIVAGLVAGASILLLGAGWFGLVGFVGVAFILRK